MTDQSSQEASRNDPSEILRRDLGDKILGKMVALVQGTNTCSLKAEETDPFDDLIKHGYFTPNTIIGKDVVIMINTEAVPQEAYIQVYDEGARIALSKAEKELGWENITEIAHCEISWYPVDEFEFRVSYTIRENGEISTHRDAGIRKEFSQLGLGEKLITRDLNLDQRQKLLDFLEGLPTKP